MKVMFLTFMFVLLTTSLLAQQPPAWSRVYTFDESIIEMNTSNVIIGGNIARATFRWTFYQPEALSSQSQLKYKSRQEVFEFNCVDKRYRPYEITFLDAAGKLIHTEEGNPPARWLMVHHGSIIERLFVPACELFKRETRPPQVISDEEIELEKVARFAFSFWQRLEQAKDVRPIIQNLFAADYLLEQNIQRSIKRS